ncbi:hypothetical protein MLD38_002873 [Melastoma candidum]|uniref:Uncharacterized protein n=1 Tax=Melastoma candidum TaxID=119954 RepID=A0ACB9S081_9MYRT|nr:hypothetical protein MLD38_002873 [Melastoma candidum]
MESQLVRPEEGEQQQQQPPRGDDKNSVLKKVKAKARKLKETIARHAHAREHEHDRLGDVPDDRDLDEEEDDERGEETLTGQEVRMARTDEPTSHETEQVKNQREEIVPSLATTPSSVSSSALIDQHPDQTKDFLGPPGLEEGTKSPAWRTDPPNNQTKISDPTGLGNEEADVSPLTESIGKMTIEAELETQADGARISTSRTGSHDQFSPETVRDPIPTQDESEKPTTGSSYADKIISMTAAIADKSAYAKDVVALKLGLVDKSNTETGIKDSGDATAKREQTSDQPAAKRIAAVVTEKLSPVYEKVIETGSAVASKVRGSSGGTGEDKGVSVKEYVSEKLKPGEEDKALSELISDALRERKERMGKVAEDAAGRKGAVGYMLRKGGESPQASASGGGADEGEDQRQAVGEKEEVGLG